MIDRGRVSVRITQLLLKPLLFGGILLLLLHSQTVHTTTVSNITPSPQLTFTFDDAYSSAFAKAAPILASYGFPGVSYVDTANVGKKGRMSWEQIVQLQNDYGWEIGSHTSTHPLMSQVPASQQVREIAESKQHLTDHGLEATSFASPYGDYNNTVVSTTARHYSSHRGFHDIGDNPWPYNEYLIKVQQVQVGVSVEKVKQYIDHAVANKRWLVLVFHDLKDKPSPDPEKHEYSPAGLEAIAAYAKQMGVQATTVNETLVQSNVNLLPNSSFDEGLQGWRTDTPEHVRPEALDSGNYPESTNAIRLTSGATSTHLYSQGIDVDTNKTYMVKSYLHVAEIVRGEVGYYIDEYDAAGKWVSGQWKSAEKEAFAEMMNFAYKPSSSKVERARLQVYVTPGPGTVAYVDNIQWFPLKLK